MKGLDRRGKNKYAYAPEHVQSMPPFSVLLVGALLVLLIAVGLPWLYSSRYPETLKSKAADNMKARGSRSEPAVHTHVVRDGRPGPFPGAAAQRVARQPAPRAARSIMATVLPIYGIGIGAYVLFTMYKVFGGKSRENDLCTSTKIVTTARKKRMKGRINQEDLQKLKEKIAETEQLMQKALADMAATVETVGAQQEQIQRQLGYKSGSMEGPEDSSDFIPTTGETLATSSTTECHDLRSDLSDDHDAKTSSEAAGSSMEKPDIKHLESEEIIDVEEIISECQAVLRQRNVEKSPGNQNDMNTDMD
ncbi:ric3 acetylcholine receptor chaperone [Branchiostoma belcheri]|nr:ric3 acetylcholine receptor chaperone [Branchiostoma belcheri]